MFLRTESAFPTTVTSASVSSVAPLGLRETRPAISTLEPVVSPMLRRRDD